MLVSKPARLARLLARAALLSLVTVCVTASLALADDNAPARPKPQKDPVPPSEEECLQNVDGGRAWNNGQCECADGHDEMGTVVAPQRDGDDHFIVPLCGDHNDDSSQLPPGTPPTEPLPTPTPTPPPELTPEQKKALALKQCTQDYRECNAAANTVARNCVARGTIKVEGQLGQDVPCFNLPKEDVWNSITQETPILRDTEYCYDYRFGEDSYYGNRCYTAFKYKIMQQCLDGISQTTRTYTGQETSSTTSSSGVKVGTSISTTIGASHTSTKTQTHTVEVFARAGQGISSACYQSVNEQMRPACDRQMDACEKAANEIAQIQAPAVETTVERLISRIDRVRLGLVETSSSGPLSGIGSSLDTQQAGSGSQSFFTPLKQQQGENRDQFLMRLAFLVRWSDYLKATDPSPELQRALEITMRQYDGMLRGALEEFVGLASGEFAERSTDMPEADRIYIPLWESYVARGGLLFNVSRHEINFVDEIEAGLGEDIGSIFRRRVLPSLTDLMIIDPFTRPTTGATAAQTQNAPATGGTNGQVVGD